MGWGAARKLRRSIDNLRRILAVELVCAARGARPARPAAAGRRNRRSTGGVLRDRIAGPGPDRWLVAGSSSRGAAASPMARARCGGNRHRPRLEVLR